MNGYEHAKHEILAGRAEARALWVIVVDEHQRDGYYLKPTPWEGPGEYQHVQFQDGSGTLVKINDKSLPRPKRVA